MKRRDTADPSTLRLVNVEISKKFCVGSAAEYIPDSHSASKGASGGAPPSANSFATTSAHRMTHMWMCYLRPAESEDEALLYALINYVTFRLDKSFPDPIRDVTKPPFYTAGCAWAEHPVEIVVHFVSESGLKPMVMSHLVHLRRRAAVQECRINLTAVSVIAGDEPTKAPPVDDDDAGTEAGDIVFTERTDAVFVAHPTLQTFRYFEQLDAEVLQSIGGRVKLTKNDGGGSQRHLAIGERRREVVLELERSATAVSYRNRGLSLALVLAGDPGDSDEMKRGVASAIIRNQFSRSNEWIGEMEYQSIAMLSAVIEQLAEERQQLVAEHAKCDAEMDKSSRSIKGLLVRLSTRCKRMRGEAAQEAIDVDDL